MQADDAFALRILCYCRFLSQLYDLPLQVIGPLLSTPTLDVFSNCVEVHISEAG